MVFACKQMSKSKHTRLAKQRLTDVIVTAGNTICDKTVMVNRTKGIDLISFQYSLVTDQSVS